MSVKTTDATLFEETRQNIAELGAIGRSLSDKTRRMGARSKKRALCGELLPLLYDFIDVVFSPEVAVELKKIADPSVNLLARIAEETTLLYRSPALRRLARQKSAYQEALVTLMPEGLDGTMRSAHRRLAALGKIALRPVFCHETGRLQIHQYSPDNLVVISDPRSPNTPLAVAYSISDRDEKGREINRWVYFDRNFQRVLNDQFEDISENVAWYDGGRPQNPYGEIPFVFISLGEDEDDFWQSLSATDGLYRASLLVALNKTDKQHKMKWASFKQLAVRGELRGDSSDIYRDPAVIFQLEGDAAVDVLDTQTDFEGYDRAIRANIADVAAGFGASLEDFTVRAAPQSGFAMLLEREKLMDRNNLQKPLFQKAESELYRLIAKLISTHKPSGAPRLEENDVLSVEFTNPPPAQDFSSLIEGFEKQLKLGIVSPVDIYRLLNPGATEEEAEKTINKNLELTRKMFKETP